MKTDLNYIKKLIKMLEGSEISELEIEEEGTKVRLVKNKSEQSGNNLPAQLIAYPPPQQMSVPIQAQPPEEQKTEPKPETKQPSNLIEIKSPIVGTLYRAPSPTADPYVQIGQTVEVGTVLCIIEAMKLMNEIESEVRGKIAKILVENAQPVEYNQVLFLVEPL